MKKTYAAPTAEVLRFETDDVLLLSDILQKASGGENAPAAGSGFSFNDNTFKPF